MDKRLYVGNLSYEVRDQELLEFFADAGPVATATVVIDHGTGRSRGFGFVEMENEEYASKAIEMFNNQPMRDRTLRVNHARPLVRQDRDGM